MLTGMTSRTRRLLLLALLGAATVVGYGVMLVVTAFLACGISGCGGGGFGRSFSPGPTQVALLLCGGCFLPFVLVVLRRQPRWIRLGGGLAVVGAGALLTMAMLDLAPSGCPVGQDRTTTSTSTSTGEATCSGDPSLRGA